MSSYPGYHSPSDEDSDHQPPKTSLSEGSRQSHLFHSPRRWTDDNRERLFISSSKSLITGTCPIFNPHGWFKHVWNAIIMIVLIFSLIDIPYVLAFDVNRTLSDTKGIITFLMDIIFLIDILVTFRTAYLDEYDTLRLETDPNTIAKRYLFGWFTIDLLTSIPSEFIFSASTLLKLLRTIKLLRLARLIKLINHNRRFTVKREILVIIRLITIISFMLLYAHLSACLWYYVGCESNKKFGTSWIAEIDSIHHNCYDNKDDNSEQLTDPFVRYSYAWYWSIVTLFTTGYGDITATNIHEQWVASISILIGSCFFAYFIGTLTTLIGEGDGVSSYVLTKMEAAQHFCDRKKLPPEMVQAILTHTRYHCSYNYVFDENEVLHHLPPYLQMDISFYVARRVLNTLDFLDDTILDPIVRGSIALKMRSISCNRGYKLYQTGDIAQQIYIQRTGIATHIIKGDKKLGEKVIKLGRGDVSGEYALILKRRTSTVIANTWCEFYVLDVSDIKDVLKQHYEHNWEKKWLKILKFVKKSYNNRGEQTRPRFCSETDLRMGRKETVNMHIAVEFEPKGMDVIHETVQSASQQADLELKSITSTSDDRASTSSLPKLLASMPSNSLFCIRQDSVLRDQIVVAKAGKQKIKTDEWIYEQKQEQTVNISQSLDSIEYEKDMSADSTNTESIDPNITTDSDSSNTFDENKYRMKKRDITWNTAKNKRNTVKKKKYGKLNYRIRNKKKVQRNSFGENNLNKTDNPS